MLLEEIQSKKTAIVEIANSYGAKNLRVFGSVARRQEGPESDVDILVELPVGYDLFKQRMPLTESLSNLIGRKVDLVPEHELNLHLRKYILQDAIDL